MPLCRQDISKSKSNNDVHKVIEKRTGMVTVNEMSEIVYNLKTTVDELRSEITELKREAQERDTKLQQLKQVTEQLTEQNKRLTTQTEQLRTRSEQLTNKDECLSNLMNVLQNQMDQQDENLKQLQAFQHQVEQDKCIQKLVGVYNVNHNPAMLLQGLESVMDRNTIAYEQLVKICNSEYPLYDICNEGYTELMTVLLQAGLDANSKVTLVDNDDVDDCNSLLFMAAIDGNVQLAKVLLEYGAYTEAQDRLGFTPIAAAAHNNHLDIVVLLKDYGANINYALSTGQSVLHVAAHEGHLDIVKYLVWAGADTTTRMNLNNNFKTPFDSARYRKHWAVVNFLKQHPH